MSDHPERRSTAFKAKKSADMGKIPSTGRKSWRSEELFGSANEVVLLHDGDEYRLRITKNNKLILTK